MDLIINFINTDREIHLLLNPKSKLIIFANEKRIKQILEQEPRRAIELKNKIELIIKQVKTMQGTDFDDKTVNKKLNELYTKYTNEYNTKKNHKTMTISWAQNISWLNESFEEEVSKYIIPYFFQIRTEFLRLLKQSKSLNELTHLLHSLAIALLYKYFDDKQKETINKHLMIVGKKDELTNEIIKLLSDKDFIKEIDSPTVLILNFDSFTNTKVMIIRDLGHSTTITIEDDNKIIYNIPKANSRQVAALKEYIQSRNGFFNMTSDNQAAYGSIEAKNNTINIIKEILLRLPSDLTYFDKNTNQRIR